MKHLPTYLEKTVRSSVLKRIKYNPVDNKLVVCFNSGNNYEYMNVPSDVVVKLLSAKSKGRAYNQYVRMSFPVRRII